MIISKPIYMIDPECEPFPTPMALGGDGECLVATARGCPGTVGALHLIGGGRVQNPGIDGNGCHKWPIVSRMCRVIRFSLARFKTRFESSAFLGY